MKLYIFLMSFFQSVYSYKPVLLIHGVLSEADHLLDLKKMIEAKHPGTEVHMVSLYPQMESFVPLLHQLWYWRRKVEPIMKNATDGVHLVCHSQGGLICQGLIETMDDHNVHSFIALGSPINGQFGIPDKILSYLPWLKGRREALSKYMYSIFTQHTLSISNYWKDPRSDYQEEYYEYAKYLPVMQNQPNTPQVKSNETEAIQRKKNFLKLKKLVLVGGPDDGVISPWQSSLFGYYDKHYVIRHMKEQAMFVGDWFGLQTLYNRGDVHTFVYPGITHIHWHSNRKVFKKSVLPFLN